MVDPRRLLLSVTSAPAIPVIGVAGEVLSGLRMLTRIAEHTAAMVRTTGVLPDMQVTMQAMARDTAALPELAESIARVAAATEILPEVEARLGSIESAMPVLVEVQQHLTRVPEILERLDARMDRTAGLLERLLLSLEQLSGDVEVLGSAVGPLGRLARRVPGRRRAAESPAEAEPDAPQP